MTTWNTGRTILSDRIAERSETLERFVERIRTTPPVRVPGTALYLARDPKVTPHGLVQNLKHNKVLHERVVILAVHTITTARVSDAERVRVDRLATTSIAWSRGTVSPRIPRCPRCWSGWRRAGS